VVLAVEILNITSNKGIPTAHEIDVRVTGINPGTLTSYKIIDLTEQNTNFVFSNFILDSFSVDDSIVGSDGPFEFARIAQDTSNFGFRNFSPNSFKVGDAGVLKNFVFDSFLIDNFSVGNKPEPVYSGEATFKTVVTLANNALHTIEVTTSDLQIARATFTSMQYNPRPMQTFAIT
jgi:hypothetical protein